LIALCREGGESLVQLRERPPGLGDDALRRALLFGNPRSQAVERSGRIRNVGTKRLGCFHACTADTGRRLLYEGSNGGRLDIDPRPDLLERDRSALHQVVGGGREAIICFANRGCCRRPGRLDLRKVAGQRLDGTCDRVLGTLRSRRENGNLLVEGLSVLQCLSPGGLKLLG